MVEDLTASCRLRFRAFTVKETSDLFRALRKSAEAMHVDPIFPDVPNTGVLGVFFLFLGLGFRRAYFRDQLIDQKIAAVKSRKRKNHVEIEDLTGYSDNLKRTYLEMIIVGSLLLLGGILLNQVR